MPFWPVCLPLLAAFAAGAPGLALGLLRHRGDAILERLQSIAQITRVGQSLRQRLGLARATPAGLSCERRDPIEHASGVALLARRCRCPAVCRLREAAGPPAATDRRLATLHFARGLAKGVANRIGAPRELAHLALERRDAIGDAPLLASQLPPPLVGRGATLRLADLAGLRRQLPLRFGEFTRLELHVACRALPFARRAGLQGPLRIAQRLRRTRPALRSLVR